MIKYIPNRKIACVGRDYRRNVYHLLIALGGGYRRNFYHVSTTFIMTSTTTNKEKDDDFS